MAEDKSIDGLSTRSAKKAEAKKAPQKSSKRVKTVSPEDFARTPDNNLWDSIIEDAKPTETPTLVEEINIDEEITEQPKPIVEKPVKRPRQVDGFTPIKKEEKPLSFLKPVAAYEFDEEDGLTESEDTVEEIKQLAYDEDEDEDDTAEAEKDSEEEIMSEKTAKKKAKKDAKKLKKKPISKKRKVISITALVVVILLIGVVVWAIFWGNDIIAKITGGRGNIFDFFVESYEPLKTDANGRTNILAIGTGGYNMDGDEGNGVHDGAQLTDSIMLISFDQNTGDVAMISLPRDLKGPATCTSTGKINEVYWCNGGGGDASVEQEEKAATAVMDAVGEVLGVDIQYYAHLNWGSLASIVDLLGGITVTLDEDINDYQYTEAVFKAGVPYEIDGSQAVGLARARHGTTGGDFSRGTSQQKIIVGIKNKLLEKQLSIPDILSLVSTLGDNLRTNFSVAEIKTLGHDLTTLDFDVMRHISLYPDYMTTGMLNGISYVLPKAGAGNYKAIQLYVAKQLSSDPRDYEEPTIAIYNASNTDGLAGEEKIKLENKGYTINLIDNAPEGEYEQGTSIYVINPEKAGTKRLLTEEYNYELKPAEELPAGITPDYDFIIILNDK